MNSFDKYEVLVSEDPSIELTSNPPASSRQSSSIFGESACGTPFRTQRLVINFTPNEGVDNEIVQKKCCDFWQFMWSRRELQHVIAMPDTKMYGSIMSSESSILGPRSSASEPASPHEGQTAVSMLNLLEMKGLIDRTFEAKLIRSHCSFDRDDNMNDGEIDGAQTRANTKPGNSQENSLKEENRTSLSPLPPIPEVQNLCKNLNEWDRRHPKSMEPPGQTPILRNSLR